ncbi:MAG: AIPR family protein [Magnetococcus sp. DMHC-1]|nr:AIPR family protein [Magnetococcales bacterium]
MNIHAAIIDQRLSAICDEIRQRANDELNIVDDTKLKSLAFVFFLVRTILDISDEDAFDCLTEGGGDFGVDAMHLAEERDGEFTVTLFQAKYKKSLEGSAHFPETGIKALLNAIRYLFDPLVPLGPVNDRIKARVEEIRSLIRDGYIPRVRALACNNGLRWNTAAEETIKRSGFDNQVIWEHVNHDRLVMILQSTQPVDDILRLSGKAMSEDLHFSRVLVGRMAVTEVALLVERHGERLLERNIRRYLGLHGNRVNEGIRNTLLGEESRNFYYYNNGITMICEKFSFNALQSGDYQVKVEKLQIINGAQTCMTVFNTIRENQHATSAMADAHVLIRLYQLADDNEDQVQRITFATNSQNPVDLRDLRANDERQRVLQTDMEQLGYRYQRKRLNISLKPNDITSGVAAEAILSVWRQRPQQAKFFGREHFGKLYDIVFTNDLNGSQVILAVLIHRIAENRRRRPQSGDPLFVRYASCFLAMRMGVSLLRDLKLDLSGLNHKTFDSAKQSLAANGEQFLQKALQDIEKALERLYGDPAGISLQQLAATFRRGDLMDHLQQVDAEDGLHVAG